MHTKEWMDLHVDFLIERETKKIEERKSIPGKLSRQ
jgi:hypothetical protein